MGEMFQRVIEIFRLDLMLQLGLATLLGGAIGLERELGGKPAGLRTNILICIGSGLYTPVAHALGWGAPRPPPGARPHVTRGGVIRAGARLPPRGARARVHRAP